MQRILIETNENDYMTYFSEAANALNEILENWNFLWNEKEIKDRFISLTEAFHFVIKGEKIPPAQVEQMYNDLEVYFGEEEIKKWAKDGGNGSEVYLTSY
jgi:hypothetical protein